MKVGADAAIPSSSISGAYERVETRIPSIGLPDGIHHFTAGYTFETFAA